MKNRMLRIIIFLLLISTTSFGQSSFQGLTPGASTRDEVNRVLGRPVNTDSTIIAEHTPPEGVQKVEVVYARNSDVASQIYIHLPRPVTRRALIQKFELPQQADLREKGENGYLHELFGGQSLLTLVYESADADSGVKLIVYHSKASFDYVLKTFKGEVDLPPQAQETYSSWAKLDMCETAWEKYCDTWVRQGNSWRGWGVPLKITVSGNSVRVERSDSTGLKAIYTGTISGNRIQGTVDFCCDGLGNRRGTWEAIIRTK